ncbi:hypothetical protein HID58_044530 [Brassica napus]|uniref:Pectin acetylesterase n=1 Tax=Brassica napus TaxID=3708 RepID=A0ABQ8BJN9_BRANA|nr:hypothetical protein HID58_044530 [Brassica napus]
MAISTFSSLLRYRKWAKSNWIVASLGLLLIVFSLSFFLYLTSDSVPSVDHYHPPITSPPDLVKLKLSSKAKERGAFCLDGSLPGYHFSKGSGSGTKSWLIHLEGGSWCNTIASCSARAMTRLGSSKYFEHEVSFQGVLSSDPSQNPDFFNWNRVKVRYCDGASFSGRPEAELKNETRLFFRGQLIWEAIIDELLSMGMSNAKQVAAESSCSYIGIYWAYLQDVLLVAWHLLYIVTTLETICQKMHLSSVFLTEASFLTSGLKKQNLPDVLGNPTMRSFYHDVVKLQGLDKSLDQKCAARTEPSKCMFPQEFVNNIRTPVFLVNAAYDYWQIQHVLVPASANLDKSWAKCRLNIKECDAEQMKVLHGFRSSLMDAIGKFHQNKAGGMFIDSCYSHSQMLKPVMWHSPTSTRIKNKTIAESVGDWYFNRKPVKLIDRPYPCNPYCYNMNFT